MKHTEAPIATRNGYKVFLEQDTDATSPRENDNVGKMICWNRQYDLGDDHDFSTPEDFLAWKKEQEDAGEEFLMLPLTILDHGNLWMQVGQRGTFACDPGGWDQSQVGWIYVTKKKALAEYGVPLKGKNKFRSLKASEWKAEAEKHLRGETEEYSNYLSGDVWGYIIEDKTGEQADSCWGYIGHKYAKEAALDALKAHVKWVQEQERLIDLCWAV